MTDLELLAPARNIECAKAAIDHGADAVYIGANRFGARAAVGNSIADISELCRYAHRFAVKVYVTVNTILYDDELEATRQLVEELDKVGVDAILVQDMALLEMLKGSTMPLHASTQTDNRTAEKVSWLRKIGFDRAVLARELSVSEIADIHAKVPDMELEVFVHGALCVSYSGICYASQYCFNRSANRGACAQFCRLKFDLVDSDDHTVEHGRYLLSLKDMNQSNNLERLVDAGATSFKIEGRLKDMAYVKNVTSAYSKRLDEIVNSNPSKYRRASLGHCKYTFEPDLSKTFNRGYTTYFANGRQPDIASMDTPKAIGEYVGTVKEIRGASFNVAGVASFANGDGLCFINRDRQLEGFRVNKVENNRLYPLKMPQDLQSGVRLYRNNDQQFERILAKPTSERKIPISMKLTTTDTGFALQADILGKATATATIDAEHECAQRPQHDNIVRQLTKLGTTIYECSEVTLADDFNYFIPSSTLSQLRRQVVETLEQIDLQKRYRRHTDSEQNDAEVPEYDKYTYLYNVSNSVSREFYSHHGLTDVSPAFERQSVSDGVLMQCRHCLRYSLGYCVKHGGNTPTWHEPLYLVLPDNRKFRLEFDCRNCQMNVMIK